MTLKLLKVYPNKESVVIEIYIRQDSDHYTHVDIPMRENLFHFDTFRKHSVHILLPKDMHHSDWIRWFVYTQRSL